LTESGQQRESGQKWRVADGEVRTIFDEFNPVASTSRAIASGGRFQVDAGMTACDHTNPHAKLDSRGDFRGRVSAPNPEFTGC
jgi:hypothetical protein